LHRKRFHTLAALITVIICQESRLVSVLPYNAFLSSRAVCFRVSREMLLTAWTTALVLALAQLIQLLRRRLARPYSAFVSPLLSFITLGLD
jgi:hypothetical protein